jgi:hypothetical protein
MVPELRAQIQRHVVPLWLLTRVGLANDLAEEIGSLFRDLRALFSTAHDLPASRMTKFARRLPLHLLQRERDEISELVAEAKAQGSPAWPVIRPSLVALRAKTDRLMARQQLISPADSQAYETALRWAAERGGQEELDLLQQIQDAAPPGEGDTHPLLELARSKIRDRVAVEAKLIGAAARHLEAATEALDAVTALGEYGAELRRLGWAQRDLRSEAFDPLPTLLAVLIEASSLPLQVEAAWALGEFGGPEVARRLLLHLGEVWGDPYRQTELRAALVAGLKEALDCYSLYQLASADPAPLKTRYQMLQEEACGLNLLDPGLRVDLIDTLVSLELRAERVGLGLESGSSLAHFLCPDADPPTQTIAAVAALNELTTAADRGDLWRWVQGEGGLEDWLRAWPDRLEKAAQRSFSREELRRFLMAASRFDAIREDVETSFRLLQTGQAIDSCSSGAQP